VRLHVADEPGVLGQIAGLFGEHGVSLASVIQKRTEEAASVEIVWVTHAASESAVRSALARIEALPVVRQVDAVIRVEDL
jgi:homoserine dehydrogenase